MKFLIVLVAFIVAVSGAPQARKFKTTADRIRSYNYPAEEYTVQTSDGYVLTIFRIPYSPKLNNKDQPNKPVFFLQHGLLSSSDCWILNGPEDALAYLLSDAGFDVWLGNARGNTYSKKHVTKSSLLPPFWDFTWHEIGVYDLPAMIDNILYRTGADSLHYAGHSQGTTTLMLMLSNIPRYNAKLKSIHLLAPVCYMNNMESPLAKIAAPLLGTPNLIADLFGSYEFFPSNKLMSMLGSAMCAEKSIFLPMCTNILFLIAGWDSQHFNYTMMPEIMETHPAGSSSSQLVHYLQEYVSGYYRQFDHGKSDNKKKYQQSMPPDYLVENVRPDFPILFYYSDNDYFAAVEDVHRMADRLGKNVELYRVGFKDWNHLDFIFAEDIKPVINDRVVERALAYEKSRS